VGARARRRRPVEGAADAHPAHAARPELLARERPRAQIALAWLLAQGDDIAPIPGTKRVSRVEENTAADAVELSAEQIARLNDLTPATGERHNEAKHVHHRPLR
jgi:aryl-alcohol dehydrogenase-like predicted oxidoreductase